MNKKNWIWIILATIGFITSVVGIILLVKKFFCDRCCEECDDLYYMDSDCDDCDCDECDCEECDCGYVDGTVCCDDNCDCDGEESGCGEACDCSEAKDKKDLD